MPDLAASPPQRAAVRPLQGGDAPAVLAAFRSASDMDRQGEVRTLPQAERYVARLTGGSGSGRGYAVTADDILVGLVGIVVDGQNRNGWVYYWMHACHRGRGLIGAAAAVVADWALGAGGLERLELGHRVNNPASGAVARAGGFVLEGREREKFLIDGERVDVLTYGRLRTDPAPVPGAISFVPGDPLVDGGAVSGP